MQTKLSVSRTKTFTQCKKRYHFQYLLKLPTIMQPFHWFGKFLHAVLEAFHAAYINGSNLPHHKQMEAVFKSILPEYQSKLNKQALQDAYAILNGYLQFLATQVEKNYVRRFLAVEKTFTVPLTEQVGLTGSIDAIQQDPDGILRVSDYKTTKNKKYLENDFIQLLTYAWVLLQEDPTIEKIRGSYILLRHNFEHITREFTREEILTVAEIYQNYAKQISEEQNWKANLGPLCNYCDFKEKCSEFLESLKQKQSKDTMKFGATNW